MFDTFYVGMSGSTSVGPIKEAELEEVRKLIVKHPYYHKDYDGALVAYIVPDDDTWIISKEELQNG